MASLIDHAIQQDPEREIHLYWLSAIPGGHYLSNHCRAWRDVLDAVEEAVVACRRGVEPRLAERYDWLSPAILRFLRRVATQCREADVPVRICGEMGGRPLEAMALVGIGIENFSITPAAMGPIKAMVRSLDAGAIGAEMDRLLANPPRDLRKSLSSWAKKHNIVLD